MRGQELAVSGPGGWEPDLGKAVRFLIRLVWGVRFLDAVEMVSGDFEEPIEGLL